MKTSFVAILLCFSCGSSDGAVGAAGAAGQSGGRGGQGGKDEGQSGKNEGQSGEAGSGTESAGASGDAGASAGGLETSSGGSHSGGDHSGGTAGTGGHSGEHASGGSSPSGGRSGQDECVWDPASSDQCPACDGNADCAEPGYKYVGSGAITSSCCGFVWQEQTAPGKYSWSEAVEYCASLSLMGRGWRLPKIAELFSLVDLGDETHTSPTIDVEAFSDTLREVYWSSSAYGAGEQAAWTVNFSNGASQPIGIDEAPRRVRCVR